jgi:hypothetical protein
MGITQLPSAMTKSGSAEEPGLSRVQKCSSGCAIGRERVEHALPDDLLGQSADGATCVAARRDPAITQCHT